MRDSKNGGIGWNEEMSGKSKWQLLLLLEVTIIIIVASFSIITSHFISLLQPPSNQFIVDHTINIERTKCYRWNQNSKSKALHQVFQTIAYNTILLTLNE
jgi:hypothetical protein